MATTDLVPFRPASVSEALVLAEKLSQSGLLPPSLQKKPSDVLVVLMTGHELGLSPLQAIRGVHVINGRPMLAADMLMALVRRSGLCETFRCVESNERRAVYETKRRGEPAMRLEWTIEQAKRAGLAGKDNWVHYPAAMLRARCKADLCRAVYEDVTQGVVTREEVADGAFDERGEETNVITVTIADRTAEDWLKEADALKQSIAEAPDTTTLEALLPDIRVLPDDMREGLRADYTKRLAELQPAKRTDAIKEKMRKRSNGADKEEPPAAPADQQPEQQQ